MRKELERIEIPGEHEARERSLGGRSRRVRRARAAAAAPFVEADRGRRARARRRRRAAEPARPRRPRRDPRGRRGREAQPALFSLPHPGGCSSPPTRAPGWSTQDGSKRLLGNYREASWSPFGRFVVASRANELVALTPEGDVRWSLARPDVRFPRWGGTQTDTRIAYLSGGQLRVVGGDGKGDRLLDRRRRAERAPCGCRAAATGSRTRARDGSVRVVDVDTGAVLDPGRAGTRSLEPPGCATRVAGPAAGRVAASAGRTPTSSSSSASRAAAADPSRLERVRPVPLALVSHDRAVVLRALIAAACSPRRRSSSDARRQGRPIEAVHVAAATGRGSSSSAASTGTSARASRSRGSSRARGRDVDLWLVHQLNPDGFARRSRTNARGVDLNRDFLAATQRETRIARKLILRLRPDGDDLVPPAAGGRARLGAEPRDRPPLRAARRRSVPRRSRGRRGAPRAGRTGSGRSRSSSSCRRASCPTRLARRYADAVLRLAE